MSSRTATEPTAVCQRMASVMIAQVLSGCGLELIRICRWRRARFGCNMVAHFTPTASASECAPIRHDFVGPAITVCCCCGHWGGAHLLNGYIVGEHYGKSFRGRFMWSSFVLLPEGGSIIVSICVMLFVYESDSLKNARLEKVLHSDQFVFDCWAGGVYCKYSVSISCTCTNECKT